MRHCLLLVIVALLALPANGQAPAGDAAVERYSAALARDPQNAFYQYAVAQTSRRLGLEPAAPPRVAPDRWRDQLYEMTTGAWAVQESLQLDRLAGGGDAPTAATVPVASLEGVTTPSIPFAELLAGRSPVVEPLASAAPASWYYLHAPRVSSLRRALDAMDRWGAHFLSSYALTARESRVRDRIAGQLLLRTAPELDQFYDLAVGNVLVVGSDPFFLEGSDVTVVLELKNPLLFTARFEMLRRDAVTSATTKVSILHEGYRGWKVEGVMSADRSVSAYSTVRDDVAILSNSYAALRSVADTVDKLAPSMAASEDFQYMRSVKPYDAQGEDAFLFLSDAFVRRVVGPKLKIGEARRVRCAVSLRTIAYATMMYRGEKGAAPGSIEDLIALKYLDPAALRCPDGGRYALEGDVAVCSLHNRVRSLTPNIELQLDRVSPEEAEAYARFREAYKSYWRRYVDPVGVRARFGEQTEIDATVLPLVENSIYSEAVAQLGPDPVDLSRPHAAGAIATIDLKLPQVREGDEARGLSSLLGVDATKLFGRALGDHASIQVVDAASPLAPTAAGVFGGAGRGTLGDWVLLSPILAALALPTAVVAPVRDRAALEEVLGELRARIARDGSSWDDFFGIESYQIVQGGARTVESVSIRLLTLQLRVFFTIAGDRVVVSTDRPLLDQLAAAEPSGSGRGSVRLELAPLRWKHILPSMALSYAEDSRRACLANVGWLEALRSAYPKAPHELTAESLALLGVSFVCPGGGRYVAGSNGRVECALHGTPEAPRQGPAPQPGSQAAFVLETVRRVEATLSFTPEGLTTRVRIE